MSKQVIIPEIRVASKQYLSFAPIEIGVPPNKTSLKKYWGAVAKGLKAAGYVMATHKGVPGVPSGTWEGEQGAVYVSIDPNDLPPEDNRKWIEVKNRFPQLWNIT